MNIIKPNVYLSIELVSNICHIYMHYTYIINNDIYILDKGDTEWSECVGMFKDTSRMTGITHIIIHLPACLCPTVGCVTPTRH